MLFNRYIFFFFIFYFFFLCNPFIVRLYTTTIIIFLHQHNIITIVVTIYMITILKVKIKLVIDKQCYTIRIEWCSICYHDNRRLFNTHWVLTFSFLKAFMRLKTLNTTNVTRKTKINTTVIMSNRRYWYHVRFRAWDLKCGAPLWRITYSVQ